MSTLPASEPSLFHSNTRLELRDAPSGLDPYPHQLTTWDKMTRLYLEQGRPAGLVVLPTGGGKTVVAAHWLLRNVIAKGGRVLWLAHRQSLLRQAFKTFRRLGNLAYPERKTLDLIAVSSEFHKWSAVSPDHHVIFASIQSSVMASNRGFVTELLADASAGAFVVVDEAHHAVAPQTLKLLEEIKAAGVRLLGLTATPIRTDEADQKRLGNLFDGTVIHQVSRTELSNLGILAVPATSRPSRPRSMSRRTWTRSRAQAPRSLRRPCSQRAGEARQERPPQRADRRAVRPEPRQVRADHRVRGGHAPRPDARRGVPEARRGEGRLRRLQPEERRRRSSTATSGASST
jgi:superfamily II DNA or RNA helicase